LLSRSACMRFAIGLILVGFLFVPAVQGQTKSAANDSGAAPKPVPIKSGVALLTPENSKIEFVGTHVGAKPDPRTGGFEKFTGRAEVDPATKTLKSLSVDIETGSLWTQFPMLTNHLNSPDFFDTREYPAA